MVTWGVTDAGVGRYGDGLDVEVAAADWVGHSLTEAPALDDDDRTATISVSTDADAPITGSTTRLTIPTTARLEEAAGTNSRSTARRRVVDTEQTSSSLFHGEGTTRLADHSFPLSDGSYRLSCRLPSTPDTGARTTDAGPSIVTQFQGPATVKRTDETVRLSFERPRTVTIRSQSCAALPRVTIPPTPDGLAAGISAMAAAHHCRGPGRSHPAERPHPPLLDVGESLDVPETLDVGAGTSALTITVPESLDALFVVAPLAYYLGATVSVGDVDRPRLVADSGAYERTFSPLPGFQYECASLLRQVFYLDCLAREDTPEEPPLLSAHGLDGTWLRELSVAERLGQYEEVLGERLRRRLPEWHLSTSASPTVEHVPALPYLLDDMSLVYLPSAAAIESADLLDRTLSDAYRATGDIETVDVVEPELGAGSSHAWLADGAPLDAFKTTTSAFRNRHRYDRRPDDHFTVTVVLNDESMAAEHTAVAEIYQEGAADVPIDVTVERGLSTDELAAVVAERNDFLHYIGHCEASGLRCPDGHLSMADVPESRTRTFFLNACGSYREGLRLVEQGSLAGAVTLTAVLNEQAAKVGTAFARLLVHGFSIERALRLARRRILMGKDYAVVGDGTDSLVPTRGQPAILRLREEAEGYHVTYEPVSAKTTGRRYECPFDSAVRLCGHSTETTVPKRELVSILERTSLPAVYNGAFHWSSDLASQL